ncbi:hypothetical protein HS088_TW13G01083 [Tripterygium wilfordii]|uniref:Uncharacterized protein n=1 Tax=Tripterygium wilfordii TaxID=458696 RepID=A0A7J7CVR6_TRIWF|nr:hypothetical protein HS088_TW13G01083 [Tripterygium wilfordii]
MAFVFSETPASLNHSENTHKEALSPVTTQLHLKSSTQSSSHEALDKEVILRRIRHRRSLNKVRTALQNLVGGSEQANKWVDCEDVFSKP